MFTHCSLVSSLVMQALCFFLSKLLLCLYPYIPLQLEVVQVGLSDSVTFFFSFPITNANTVLCTMPLRGVCTVTSVQLYKIQGPSLDSFSLSKMGSRRHDKLVGENCDGIYTHVLLQASYIGNWSSAVCRHTTKQFRKFLGH